MLRLFSTATVIYNVKYKEASKDDIAWKTIFNDLKLKMTSKR